MWVLEGGYTADTGHWDYRDMMKEKELQHAQLQHAQLAQLQLMHALQIRCFNAKLMILTVGLGGTVYQQAAEDLRALGVNMTSVKTTLTAIHLHSVP